LNSRENRNGEDYNNGALGVPSGLDIKFNTNSSALQTDNKINQAWTTNDDLVTQT